MISINITACLKYLNNEKNVLLYLGLFMLVLSYPSEGLISNKDISAQNVKIPQTIPGNKSHTLNGMGYVFYIISPVGESFIANECTPGKRVIEIGAGYGNIPTQALKNGVSQYIANDISEEHLKILSQRVKNEISSSQVKRLSLLPGKAPEVLEIPEVPYDAILADKVIHFMSPRQIHRFLDWAQASLRQGGKVYITAASPTKALKPYLEKSNDSEFPTLFINVMESFNKSGNNLDPEYKVPDEMVLLTRKDLIRLVEEKGMRVIESYSLKTPTEQKPYWIPCPDDEGGVVGIIAEKN